MKSISSSSCTDAHVNVEIPISFDHDDTFYDPSCLIHRLRITLTHTEGRAAVFLLPLCQISVYFYICCQTELLMGQIVK